MVGDHPQNMATARRDRSLQTGVLPAAAEPVAKELRAAGQVSGICLQLLLELLRLARGQGISLTCRGRELRRALILRRRYRAKRDAIGDLRQAGDRLYRHKTGTGNPRNMSI